MNTSSARLVFAILIPTLLAIGIIAAFQLSMKQWQVPGSCPSIGPFPACYLVLLTFVGALIGHFSVTRRWGRRLFLVSLGFPTLLALFASIGEAVGYLECPKAGSVPMCYLSLGLCVLVWIVWVARERVTVRG